MQCCIQCGSNKVENRDLSLCSTHNRERIKAERPVQVKERKPIAPISAKRAELLKDRRKAYAEVKKTQNKCACCGTTYDLTPSHVLTQKMFPLLSCLPRNVVVLCIEHHSTWEHDKASFCLHFPEVWNLKMEIMEELAPEYFQQFKQKHSQLFTL